MQPRAVAVDGSGSLYIMDTGAQRVRKVDAETGLITTVAGGNVGDGGLATDAVFFAPRGAAVDGSGNIYITDVNNGLLRKIDAETGIISTLVNTVEIGFLTDVAVDGSDNIYFAAGQVHRVDAETGAVSAIAGGGDSEDPATLEDGIPATDAALGFVTDIFVDASGNIYMTGRNKARKVDAETGTITTVAGIGGDRGFSGDGGPATDAQLSDPRGFAMDGAGNIYIGDRRNHRIRKVDAETGTITTVAGTGERGFSGDGGPATDAQLNFPYGLVSDSAGNLYIADLNNHRIRKVDVETGTITTVVGTGDRGTEGEGGPASDAQVNGPIRVIMNGAGDLMIVAQGSGRILRVDAETNTITRVAGGGEAGIGVEEGPATDARLSFGFNFGLAVDASGNIYVSDMNHHLIRRVDAGTGAISTVAGNGEAGFSGDDGPATDASINGARGVAVDGSGNVYVADTQNRRVRKVDAGTGIITTIAGAGSFPVSGDGGPATDANVSFPSGVFVDRRGDIFITDPADNRIRKVDGGTGIITTIAGAGPPFPDGDFAGDGGPATEAHVNGVGSIYVDDSGNVYFVDRGNERVRKIDAKTGIITTLSGTGERRFAGDGGPAAEASLRSPGGVGGDAAGNIYIADESNRRIRKVGPAPASGLQIELARSVGGRSAEYLWSGTTDEEGNVEIEIVLERTPRTFRLNASGYYTARAVDPATGAVIARWNSIPINGGKEVTLSLPMGGKARVVATSSLEPAPLVTNHPNPFNPATQIAYEILEPGEVTLMIYNALGQQVRTLIQERQAAGVYRVMWDGKDALGRAVSSGVYLYRLESNNSVQTRRMLLLK